MMRTETFAFNGNQGMQLPAVLWLPEGEPRAVLHLTHGMTEHVGRYEDFARQLTAHGIAVAGYDLRGHGKNAGNALVASFGENGWEQALQDMRLFFAYIAARFPQIPQHMLGLSTPWVLPTILAVAIPELSTPRWIQPVPLRMAAEIPALGYLHRKLRTRNEPIECPRRI